MPDPRGWAVWDDQVRCFRLWRPVTTMPSKPMATRKIDSGSGTAALNSAPRISWA